MSATIPTDHIFWTTDASIPNARGCMLTNGTTVYYNDTRLDCTCLAATRADADFGGAAVISSFLAMGWLTIFVAAVPTIWSMARTWDSIQGKNKLWKWIWQVVQFEPNSAERKTGTLNYPSRFSASPTLVQKALSFGGAGSINSTTGMTAGDRDARQPLPESRPPHILEQEEPTFCTFTRRITFQLCDIQIITGIAILVAAIAQEQHISFYHAQIAQQYWWMTLNSFWISRIDYSRNSPEMLTWRAHARRTAIWVSVALSIVIQIMVTIRENKDWNILVPGKCYKTDATGSSYAQNVFWLSGTALYFVVVTASLFTVSRRWFDTAVNNKIEPSVNYMNALVMNALGEFKQYRNGTRGSSTGFLSRVVRWAILAVLGLKTAAHVVVWLAWWVFILFMSIWCAGNSAAALELIIYSTIAAFLTWWILFLKVNNIHLLYGRQEQWTFGATLSLLIYVLIIFHFLDVWAGVKRDEHKARRRRADEEALQQQLQAVQQQETSRTTDFAVRSSKDEAAVSQRSATWSDGDRTPPAAADAVIAEKGGIAGDAPAVAAAPAPTVPPASVKEKV